MMLDKEEDGIENWLDQLADTRATAEEEKQYVEKRNEPKKCQKHPRNAKGKCHGKTN